MVDNQEESKEVNKSETYDPYAGLEQKYKDAIDMRLEFYKYRYIAVRLKVEEQTVGTWFMQGGTCYEAYHWKVKQREEENKELNDKVRKEILDMNPEAVIVLKNNLSKGNLDAALKVLAFNGIIAVEQLNIDTGNREKIDTLGNLIDQLSTYARTLIDRGDKKAA